MCGVTVPGVLMRSRQPKTVLNRQEQAIGSGVDRPARAWRRAAGLTRARQVPPAPERAITGEPREQLTFERAAARPTRRPPARCRASRSSRPTPPGSARDRETAGPSVCQCRSHRITRQPGTPSLASDSRTKSGIDPRSSAIRSRPADARHAEDRLALGALGAFVGRGEERGTIRPAPVGAEEPDDVIDPHAVEQHRRALGAPANPRVVGLAR